MTSPLFSIIIPTHNAEKHIEKCISSILTQSFSNFEIIVVDYNSTDKTIEHLQQINSPEISLIKFNQLGIYNAMNKGVECANGIYCLFLGADDWLENQNTLQDVSNLNPETDLITGKVKNINRKSKKIRSIYKNSFSKNLYWRNTIHHQGIFYKRDLLMKYPFDTSYKILSDYKLNLILLQKNVSEIHLENFIAKSNSAGVSKQFTKELYAEEIRLKKELLPKWAYFINIILAKLKFLIKS